MADDTAPQILSAEVAAKYTPVGIATGRMTLPKRYGSKEVDFREMSLAVADKLAKLDGFPYLVPKSATAPAKTT